MSFSFEWLGLREMYDIPARDKHLLHKAGSAMRARHAPMVVDLACGTGANVRALSQHMPHDVRWRVVDNDIKLLDTASRSALGGEVVFGDLNEVLDEVLEDVDLVTCSAFFDLVSPAWIDRFVAALPERAIVYAVLTYNGQENWEPAHPDDAAVRDAFIRHQHSDKGFGDALGPDATAYLEKALSAAGYTVETAPSDWALGGAEDGFFIETLSDGVAQAASEAGTDPSEWRGVERQSVRIGHYDLLAFPPGSMIWEEND
ncbi:MAG: class I SAM-dependent methyltransferase [Neomegalonema sp.]|nr:class I SAM-dependent methyltransferase [Neomegalonema sp.]